MESGVIPAPAICGEEGGGRGRRGEGGGEIGRNRDGTVFDIAALGVRIIEISSEV
jgi:hypothetical protein